MFHFRLETLLRLRLAVRDERRADLAKALRAEKLLRAQQGELHVEQAALAERGRKLKEPGTGDVDALLHTHRYEIVLTARLRQLAAQLTEVEAETERRRLALVEADRQVHVLEKLRQRQAGAYRQKEERRDAKQFDEQAILGYIRQQEGPP
jgi:flagellar export protein FliJ